MQNTGPMLAQCDGLTTAQRIALVSIVLSISFDHSTNFACLTIVWACRLRVWYIHKNDFV